MNRKALLSITAVFIFILFSPAFLPGETGLRVEHLSVEHGLSAGTVFCIAQDSRGYMWFGTEDGLNRYDGYNITIFQNRHGDPASLSHNYIQVIYQSPVLPGVLWVGTPEGLNKFDCAGENFSRFMHADSVGETGGRMPGNPGKCSVNALYESVSQPGILWVGTSSGLYRFHYKEEKAPGGAAEETFGRFLPDPDRPSAPANTIRVLFGFSSSPEILWAGTSAGLYRFNCRTRQFDRYLVDASDAEGPANIIRAVYGSQKTPTQLWVGTHGAGINRFDCISGKFTPFASFSRQNIRSICESMSHPGVFWVGGFGTGLMKYNAEGKLLAAFTRDSGEGNSSQLSSNDISSIYEDRSGVLWIGTSGGGVDKYHGIEKFKHFKAAHGSVAGLSHAYVRSIYEDYAGNLWIGTTGGLNKFDRKARRYTYYRAEPGKAGQISDNRVNAVFESFTAPGILWVGTANGLNRLDGSRGVWTSYGVHGSTPNGLSHPEVTCIYESPAEPGTLWIGTSGGLDTFNFQAGTWAHYTHSDGSEGSPGTGAAAGISSNEVLTIYEDSDGILWIGTGGGLNRYDRKSNAWTVYSHAPGEKGGLSHNKIWAVYQSPSHPRILWIGTPRGLNKLDLDSGAVRVYGEKDGLPNEMIFGILGEKEIEGKTCGLWLSTNKGLSRFNIEKEIFKNYDIRDGLQHNVFTPGAFFRSRRGEMFFGGINGFNAFFPGQVKDDPVPPQVVFTRFLRFNKEVGIGEVIDDRVILKKAINETPVLVLSYRDGNFSFEFAALHYGIPEKNKYRYKMEGFNKDWVDAGTRRFADYTNLSPGKYVFKVEGANNDGVWSTEARSIRIRIKPPFWQTWWFRIVVLLAAAGLAFALHKLRVRQIQAQNVRLEGLVEKRTQEIRAHSTQIQKQKEVIEEKNDQIMSSIRYAERIQDAILPIKIRVDKILPDRFVIFMPKDIVSGDFYWINEVEDKIVVAVVDCTGHGVPGAFMSMIGNTLLNQIIMENKILDPASILDHLNVGVRQMLKQEKGETESHDGMDVCICVMEDTAVPLVEGGYKKKLTFAGARRPLYLMQVKDGVSEFIEIRGTRHSIGGRQPAKAKKREFQDHVLDIQVGDMLYLTSDGFIDQQNVEEVRFGSRRLKNFLKEISGLDLAFQKERLLAELRYHQGDEGQMDDITIVGVRI